MQFSTLHIIFILALFSLAYADFSSKSPLSCSDAFLGMDTYLEMKEERNTTKCKKLSTLQAQFAWNYYITSRNQTHINVLIGTKLITDMGWLAWGVNPDLPQMVGTSAIIAIKMPNQSTPVVHTYSITKDIKLWCTLQPSDIDLRKAWSLRCIRQVSRISIAKRFWTWRRGVVRTLDTTGSLLFHPFASVRIRTDNDIPTIHGILNIIGWGTLLPIGVIIARYFREFPFKLDTWWFTFHSSCQVLGYILGSIGWGLGLLLGYESKYYTFHTHRVLGISIFGFTTLQVTQMLAFLLKPTREDEYRKHWNVYHHLLGYSLLVMIPVNIYQGIKILKQDNRNWKWAYNGILVFLAMVVLALEIYTWTKFLCKKYKRSWSGNVTH
ncbi:hypothetical protein CRYUN_Cryun39dG0017900 [Craigia yunnanensis]